MKRLETERLILDKWTKKDARDLFAYASTNQLIRICRYVPVKQRMQTLNNYRQIVLREKVCKRCAFAATQKQLQQASN